MSMVLLTIDQDAIILVVGTTLDLDLEYLPGRSVRLLMMIQEYFYFLSIVFLKEICCNNEIIVIYSILIRNKIQFADDVLMDRTRIRTLSLDHLTVGYKYLLTPLV